MAYISKTQISIKYTEGGFLKDQTTGKNYIGDYILTGQGEYYAGKDNTNLTTKLVLVDDSPGNRSSKPTPPYKRDVRKFDLLKKNIKNFLRNTETIPSFKNIPTEEDYDRGYYDRYFTSRINDINYIEVSEETYNSISKKDGVHDHYLYEVDKLRWYITGNDVHKQNSLSIQRLQVNYPNLFLLFPILNEFLRPSSINREDLITEGGELYYADGSEYIGAYHIHPEQGPMVGAKHVSVAHAKLYYFNQLPNVGDESYEDFTQQYGFVICYKCVQVGSDLSKNPANQLVAHKFPRINGCPKGFFEDQQEAIQACPKVPTNGMVKDPGVIYTPEPSSTTNIQPATEIFSTRSVPSTPSTPSTPSYGGGSSGGGGGSSGGGGGGY